MAPQRPSGRDYVPQATHLVWEAPLLVTCATCFEPPVGTADEDARQMRKADLDPMLAAALVRWQQNDVPLETPVASLVRWFDDIKAEVRAREELDTLAFNAGAIALLARDDGAAIAQSGLERAWRWRDDRLEQVTSDHGAIELVTDEVAEEVAVSQSRVTPAASFRARNSSKALGWCVRAVDLRVGDVVVLASGVHATTLETDYISDAVGDTLRTRPRVAGAQDVADRIGALAERVGAYAYDSIEWNIHSRLALAVVWF